MALFLCKKKGKDMLRTCQYCGRIVDTNHRCKRKPTYEKKDKEIVKFRNSKEWKNKRNEIGMRDKHLCRYCLKNNRIIYESIDVHHIIPLKNNFELRLDNNNLISLCRMCHEEAEKGNISKEELQKIIRSPAHI